MNARGVGTGPRWPECKEPAGLPVSPASSTARRGVAGLEALEGELSPAGASVVGSRPHRPPAWCCLTAALPARDACARGRVPRTEGPASLEAVAPRPTPCSPAAASVHSWTWSSDLSPCSCPRGAEAPLARVSGGPTVLLRLVCKPVRIPQSRRSTGSGRDTPAGGRRASWGVRGPAPGRGDHRATSCTCVFTLA